MANKSHTAIAAQLSPRRKQAGFLLLYFGLPAALFVLLLGISWLASMRTAAPEPRHLLASRLLVDQQLHESPNSALEAIQGKPARLSHILPAGQAWLLADLPENQGFMPEQPDVVLLPGQNSQLSGCWIMTRQDLPDASRAGVLAPVEIRPTAMGYRISAGNDSTNSHVLCSMKQSVPGHMYAQLWQAGQFEMALENHSLAAGLLEGSLLALAIFLATIGLTTREHPYMLLALWVLGNLRLGAWALGWDHLWFGHAIAPEYLAWLRRATVVLYFLFTTQLFTHLYRFSLEQRVYRRLGQLSIGSAGLLALAMLYPAHGWFQVLCFLAAWLGTALVSLAMIHALMRFSTRARLLHTVGVVLALGVLLSGLIAMGLTESLDLPAVPGALLIILCNILVALAVADHMREARQTSLRLRNDLIAHDSLSPLGLFTLGATRNFEHLNPNARTMLELEQNAETHALAWEDFFPPQDWLQISLATEQGQDTEIHMHADHQGGQTRSFLLRATLAGSRIEGSLQDISARDETIRKLRLMADNDPLTNTLNRRGIEGSLQACVDELAKSGTPCAIGFLDLDHLKRVNDIFGHSAGDTLLQMVCERLRYTLGEKQHIGRIGNDEFIILFPGMHAGQARQLANDMIESLNGSPLFVGERAFQLKSAMGIIELGSNMHPKDAIAAASRACREARKKHQDIVLYDENADELQDHIDEAHLFEQLESGMPPSGIYMLMQPIMSLRHPLAAISFEALLRVRSTSARKVQTGRIIEAAEDNGMVTSLDKWVFANTLEWLINNQKTLKPTQQVNVNLSGVSLNDDRFIDSLFGMLNLQPQFTRRLCVEITEGVALQDLERTRQFMRRLQRMGAKVALDDFGAGYTSFSYLKELPADMIKIDGTLVCDMLKSEANIAIVNSIVDLAHNLGMECIAEWVEDLPTLRTLAEMGMDHVQGYVISPPRDPDVMLAHKNILPLIEDPATRAYIEEISGRRFTP